MIGKFMLFEKKLTLKETLLFLKKSNDNLKKDLIFEELLFTKIPRKLKKKIYKLK